VLEFEGNPDADSNTRGTPMMPIRNVTRTVSCGFVLFLISVPALWAHAILMEASPAKNGSVKGPDFNIRLKFNSRIDASRSQITLVLPDNSIRALPIEKQASPEVMSTKAAGLKPGAYRLRWQVLASDGHITRGEYPFEVK
jgi:methionine-rich copper-binding protein CopC